MLNSFNFKSILTVIMCFGDVSRFASRDAFDKLLLCKDLGLNLGWTNII